MDYAFNLPLLPSGVYQMHGQGKDEEFNGEIVIFKDGFINYTGEVPKKEPIEKFQEKASPYLMLQKIC